MKVPSSDLIDIFSYYPRHAEINDWLNRLSVTHPKMVTVMNVGETFQKRQLLAVRISNGTSRDKKPVVFIDGGCHAREWITIMVALFCAYQLTEKHRFFKGLLERMDFVILPVVNADGYEFTHTFNRFWRKTRRPSGDGRHIGTDCNRNYDVKWTRASSSPSLSTYRGDAPFSEPETQAVRQLLNDLKGECKFYITLHSHARALMYPWGHSKALPVRWKELHRIAKAGSKAIKDKTGVSYRYGTTSSLLRKTVCGSSADYAFDSANIPYVVTMELSPGGSGFDPPCSEIKVLTRESWIGIRAMCKIVGDTFCKAKKSTKGRAQKQQKVR